MTNVGVRIDLWARLMQLFLEPVTTQAIWLTAVRKCSRMFTMHVKTTHPTYSVQVPGFSCTQFRDSAEPL